MSSLVFSAVKAANAVDMYHNYQVLVWLADSQNQKSLTHRWHFVYNHLNDILTAIGCSTIACKNAYSRCWQLINHFYVQTFASKSVWTAQFLINHSTHYPSDIWCQRIMIQYFRLAINRMLIHTLIFDIYSPTSSLFLIQLILHDFHDLPLAIFNILTLCTR